MRRLRIAVIIVILAVPLCFVPLHEATGTSDSPPFTPHDIKVLVVSPADTYYKGGHYLISDLARYGFNVTQHTSGDAKAINYTADFQTSNLEQYNVVILHSTSLAFPPAAVTLEEVNHFVNFGGILIVIGNSLFSNETSGTWWDNLFTSAPIQRIEQRLGVDFTSFMREVPPPGGAQYYHNNGTFTLKDTSIKGLPQNLTYITIETIGNVNSQLVVATSGANQIYEFTTEDSKTTSGVTYYRNSTGAIGIYIQGAYIYATNPAPNKINYYGFTDISKRSALLASLIAFALGKDVDTIIKPQPLANVRLDGAGQYYFSDSETEKYLNASLYNFNSVIDAYNITPSIGFIDFLSIWPTYWQTYASKVLSQLKGKCRDWEYSSNLRYFTDPGPMTTEQIKALIDNIKGNYSKLGMDLFSTIIAPRGLWNQSTLDAMVSKNLYLIDILDTETYYSDWWTLRVNSSVIVHTGAEMLREYVYPAFAENFTQTGLDKDSIHSKYFTRRDKFALATVNGFASFVYYVPNFRRNEVGTYSLQTLYENLTSEIPDIKFVPLMEAGLYFGNRWMRVENASRAGSVIEFDVDASAIPDVVNIGKGMLWLKISANEPIQEVLIDNNPWFYFDSNSIRLPAPTSSSHVKITLGEFQSPRVIGSRYKVVEAGYDGYRFTVSIPSAQGLNVSVHLLLPQVGPFKNASWSVLFLGEKWKYNFDPQSRIFEFWAISEGPVKIDVGVFWSLWQTPPLYNSSVTITINVTGLQVNIQNVILSYNKSDSWINTTMTPNNGLWVAVIPAMPYGIVVEYKVFISNVEGRWVSTGVFTYNIIDEFPPEVGVPTWDPLNPVADKPVSVSVSVAEPENASGVKEVVLWYYPGSGILGLKDAKSINMTSENDHIWSAVIPEQSDGALISFFILAYDRAGNVKQTTHYSYTVGSPTIPLIQIILLAIGVVGVIGITLYFVKYKKRKH